MKWLRKIIGPLMYNCEEATLLMAKRDEGKLTVVENIRLKIHLAVCGLCTSFDQQVGFIADKVKHDCYDHQHLPDEFKRELAEKLKG